ncbi:IMS-domain-containing protein [Hymenopellis radicata]|nr:IMS-domain-containing protein [Hymenopellis radicata]
MSKAPKSSNETDSLIRRLAGPSTGKAGLAKDQTEINRVIAEASKGSKFYENEKRKDQDLTERIDKILKLRDELTKGVDLRKIEHAIDVLLKELEEQRDLSQFIVHVDMDAFYASVELLFNPALKGKPFAVGYGVLTTASYDARKFGVRSGMPGFIAKKLCPDLIFVSNNFSRYGDMSKKVMAIFERYDPNMCAAGCDEGYLNITSYCNEHDMTPDACVEEIRKTVQEETKLTVSAGIAPNKVLAKICSDKNKPNGQFHLPFDSKAILAFMRDLSIRKVPGIGRVNERLLDSIGIKTCGDISTHRAVISLMDKQFGLHFLLRTHLGIASNVVQPIQREERKSIGSERTFNPIDDKEKLLQKLEEISVELEADMARDGWTGRTITLKYKLDTYQVFTRAKSCDRWVTKKEDLFKIGKDLLLPEFPLKLRLIGLRVTKLKDLRLSEPISGIKRFFEPAKGEQPESKRQKTVIASEWEETMPGFHENDDSDMPEDQARTEETPPATRPPNSEPTRPSQEAVKVSIKPRSAVQRKAPAAASIKTSQDCPICGKTMLTDNQGLNDHIDFCLSRGVILQAQSEASVESRSHKPKSKRKGH